MKCLKRAYLLSKLLIRNVIGINRIGKKSTFRTSAFKFAINLQIILVGGDDYVVDLTVELVKPQLQGLTVLGALSKILPAITNDIEGKTVLEYFF